MVRVEPVSSMLSSHGGWLLVGDNVDATQVQECLGGFLPGTGVGGRLVLTSRIPDWSADFAVLHP